MGDLVNECVMRMSVQCYVQTCAHVSIAAEYTEFKDSLQAPLLLIFLLGNLITITNNSG